MAAARRPSPHNSPWTVGTKSSAIPHTRTQSWTASFTMLTESNSPAKACDGPEANRTRRVDHTASPMPEIHRPERLATRAASFRNGGRHHPGIPGGIIPLYPGGFVGIRRQGRVRLFGSLDQNAKTSYSLQAACSRSNSSMTALARSRMACFIASLITPAEGIVASTICRSRTTSFFDSGRTMAANTSRWSYRSGRAGQVNKT